MDTDLYRHYIYQMLLALFVCVIFVAGCSVIVKKLLIQYDVPFVKRRLLIVLFFLGVIPLWIEVIHFIPFNGEHIAKLLAKLPEKAELFLIDALNPVFAVIYSYMSHVFLITYIAILLGIVFLPRIIENISDKRLRFASFTLATAGLYPVYAGISFLYNPRIINRLRRGTEVFRNPAQAEKAILSLTKEEDCKGIKIHENIEYPFIRERQHFFLIGGPGSGKTNAVYKIISSVRNRGDRMIIYDRKGDYTEAFGEEEGVIMLSPFDQRGFAWDIAKDISTEIMADEFSSSLIAIPKNSKDTQWYEAAQDLLTGVLVRLQAEKGKDWGFDDLSEILACKRSVIESCQQYRPAALQTIGDVDDKQTAGVFMNIRNATKKIHSLATAWAESKNVFSLLDWLKDDKHEVRTIIVGGNSRYPGLDNFLTTQFLNMVYSEVLAFPDSFTRRIWAINDEQGSQPPVKNLLRALAEGRSKGLCIVSAVQDIGQIRDKFGRDQAQTWFTNYGIIFGGRVSDPDTAAFLAKAFGQNRVVKTSVSVTEELDRISRSTQEINEAALLDSDFSNLPNATLKDGALFWLRVSGWPAAKLRYKIEPLPKKYVAQKPMEWLSKPPVKIPETDKPDSALPPEKEEITERENVDFIAEAFDIVNEIRESELTAMDKELEL